MNVTTQRILQIWEQGVNQSTVTQGLLLLSLLFPDVTENDLANLTIGQRDRNLLILREWLFGSQIDGVINCPYCGELAEFSLNIDDIRLDPGHREEILTVTEGEYQIQCRLPTSRDLLAISGENLAKTAENLLKRCLVQVSSPNLSDSSLPPSLFHTLSQAIAEADPQSDIQLALDCPACQHHWLALFDIVSFLWQEVQAWVMNLLRDIHQLATTYHWSEADILALSPQRRQFYLDLIDRESK